MTIQNALTPQDIQAGGNPPLPGVGDKLWDLVYPKGWAGGLFGAGNMAMNMLHAGDPGYPSRREVAENLGGGFAGIMAGEKAVTANVGRLVDAQTMENGTLSSIAQQTFNWLSSRVRARAGLAPDEQVTLQNLQKQLTPASPADIWHQTGWYRGEDGKWKFEISDAGAKLNKGKIQSYFGKEQYTLGDILDHPSLYEAYPELKNIPLKPTGFGDFGLSGAYAPETNTMYLDTYALQNKPADALNTILHETQHAVQTKEGFARGGNPDEFLPPGAQTEIQNVQTQMAIFDKQAREKGINIFTLRNALSATPEQVNSPYWSHYREALDKANEMPDGWLDAYKEIADKYQKTGLMKQNAFAQYQDLAGERESRNVEERHDQYDSFTHPLQTAGYPTSKPIIKFDKIGVPHSLEPIDHNPFGLEQVEHDPFTQTPVDHDPFKETP